jgi:UDP-N-acetylglucosamine:LPS N-acetylglucosamine transferase
VPTGEVLDSPQEWPAALAGARLLVGRFGHTLLEAAHLGTPALAVATSADAWTDALAFAAHGTSAAVRVHGPGDARAVAAQALALLADGSRLAAMAARGRELVDGRGAARVAAALRELAGTPGSRAVAATPPPAKRMAAGRSAQGGPHRG